MYNPLTEMAVVNRRAQSAGRTRPPASGLAGMPPRDPLLGGIRGTNSGPSGHLTDRGARGAGATDAPPMQWTRSAIQRNRLEDVPSYPRQSNGWCVRQTPPARSMDRTTGACSGGRTLHAAVLHSAAALSALPGCCSPGWVRVKGLCSKGPVSTTLW